MAVYVIQNVATLNVKIGHSSDPSGRLSALQSGNENELAIVAVVPHL